MNGRCRVILGLLPNEEDAITSALYSDGTIATVGSGADANELVTLAAEKPADLALLSPQLPGLDRPHIQQLRSSGLRTVGVAVDPTSSDRLGQLGLDATLTVPITAADLTALLNGPMAAPVEESSSGAVARPPAAASVGRDGSVLAVVGSRGTPGSSELAASFAAAVNQEWRALLCEIDGDGGQLAVRLGVDPREGSIIGPLRALRNGGGVEGMLEHWVTEPGRGWPTVLVGPFDPTDLAQVTAPGTVDRLLSVLATSFPLVICDVGHRLGGNGTAVDVATRLHRDTVAAADGVLVVIGTRPEQVRVGLAQVDLLLTQLAVTPDRLRVVVSGQPGCSPPRSGEAATVINRELPALGLAVDAWLPYDEKAFQAAARRGQPLAAARARGAYAQAVRELATTVLLPGVPQPAARKRRLGGAAVVAAGSVEEVRLPWRR